MRRRRLSARVRILLALGAAAAIHGAFGHDLEAVRVGVLGSVPAWAVAGPPAAGSGPPAGEDEILRRVEAWRVSQESRMARAGRAAVPVVFFRPRDRVAIIGAGSASGIAPLDPVEVPSGLLGFIDAVEPRLSRVRLLSAPRSRVPVTVADVRRDLPGALTGLNAILEGTGEGGRLVSGSLLSEFRAGDALSASVGGRGAGSDVRPVPVGVVATEGPDPAVRLHAGPGDLGFVTVASGSAPGKALFEHVSLAVRAAPCVAGSGALMTGPGAARVAPGCAVQAGGRYLGKVTLATSSAVVVSGVCDPGHRLFVRCLGREGGSSAVEMVSLGRRRFRIDGAVPEAGPLLVVTAGGQELIPADLAVGVLEPAGPDWILLGAGGWPRHAVISVFLAGDDLRRLLEP
jgi:hypothetical protein